VIVYFDSSALVKLVLDEEGTELAAELWERASWRVTSHVAYPETRAALAAAERSNRIESAALHDAVGDLDGLSASMQMLAVDGDLCWRAGVLAERHALRGYDAVHLASMIGIEAPRVIVATWDGELATAAGECGLGVVPDPSRWGAGTTGDKAVRLLV
jgi:uncharacterized protein